MKCKKTCISILIIFFIALTVTCVCASNQTDMLKETVNVNDADSIQVQIDSAKDGDTINLGENKEYTIEDTISVTKKVSITGNNVSIKSSNQNYVLNIRGTDGVSVSGIKFTNTNPLPDYGGTINGVAIYSQANRNLLITDCSFINYASGAYLSATQSASIKNSYFTGTTTAVKAGTESGTKAINLMGSRNIEIINNTFYGQVLDGLSIASGTSDVIVQYNTFINNTYAIFYGGASTEGSKIKNNRFITCGMISTTWYSAYLKQTFNITYNNLPVISLQKSSDNLEISNNTFIVKDENLIINSEAENTEHGYPSSIGSINITDNTVLKADSSVNPKTVTFYYLNVLSSLALKPTGDIIIKNNDFSDVSGINEFELKFSSIESDNGDITIPKALTETYMSVDYVKDGRVIIALYDISGVELISEKVTYTVNGKQVTDTTDEYGHIYINNLEGDVKITAKYAGSDKYYSSSLDATVKATNTLTQTAITASDLSVYAANAKSTAYRFTLTDGDKNKLAEKSVSISFNGKIYTEKSDSNGIVSFTIPTATAGKYSTTLAFAGDSAYKGCIKATTITITKQATKLTVAKKTFKKSAAKKVTAVLKDNKGKVLKSKKLTLKVNGKTYTAKTNTKGVATFTVKITKAGTFTATTKFAGDSSYSAKTATSKIIVK